MASSKPAANMLWGGRFTGGLDQLMVAYNESIYFDRAIYAQDIRGSIAYARGNSKIGILTADEFAAIEKGFKQVEAEWESGKFEIKPGVTSTQPTSAGLVR
jgi:argininosuccinate lyase